MSAEGKKKRGASGVANAASAPYRMNGRPPDWAARAVGATRGAPQVSGGSIFMRGMLGGVLAAGMGYAMVGDYETKLAHAQTRVTHPDLRAD